MLRRWRDLLEGDTVAETRSPLMTATPLEPAAEEDRRTYALAVVSTVVGLGILFVLAPSRFRFWYDSWTYYELARSIGDRFYAVNTVREFQTDGRFSTAFPPLWPVIVATFARSGLGMIGSYLASFASFVAFSLAAERFARRLVALRGVGLLSILVLMAFPGIRWDLAGGGSFALNLTFLALLGTLFLDLRTGSNRQAATLGAIAGLMVMLRFDAAPASLAALLAGVALGLRGRQVVVMGAVFAIVISPWVAYSWTHFHAPFATDNRAVALALDPDAYVMDFHTTAMPMLRDDPGAWVRKLFVHAPIVGLAAGQAAVQSVFLIPLALVALAAMATADGRRSAGGSLAALRLRPFLAFLAVALAPIAAYVVTGYQESRYFSTVVWVGEMPPSCCCCRRSRLGDDAWPWPRSARAAYSRVRRSPAMYRSSLRSQRSAARFPRPTPTRSSPVSARRARSPPMASSFARMSGCSTATGSAHCRAGMPLRRRATGAHSPPRNVGCSSRNTTSHSCSTPCHSAQTAFQASRWRGVRPRYVASRADEDALAGRHAPLPRCRRSVRGITRRTVRRTSIRVALQSGRMDGIRAGPDDRP